MNVQADATPVIFIRIEIRDSRFTHVDPWSGENKIRDSRFVIRDLAKSLSAVLSAVKYLSGAKNLSAALSAVLSAVKYLAGAKNLSAVTHISESVFFMPSGAETAAQAADVSRSLVQQLAGAMPVPGGRAATIARPTTSSRKMVS